MMCILISSQVVLGSPMQFPATRTISGVVVGPKNEVLNDATIVVQGASGEQRTHTDEYGRFSLDAPNEEVTLHVQGQYIKPQERVIYPGGSSTNLQIEIEYLIPPIHQSLVITASELEPRVDTHSDEVYKRTLFSRD